MTVDGVISGISVLELGEGIGPAYCGKLLADYGADVVKVELPEGDALRSAEPTRDDLPPSEASGLFAFLNTSKKSVTIDWRTPGGKEMLHRLIQHSDVLVHGLPLDVRETLGFAEDLYAAGCVEVAITPYGLTGPYASYASTPLTMAALCGWMFPMGDHDKAPLFPGGPYISYLAATTAATGALVALEARKRHGRGQVVDISEIEAGVSALPFDTTRFSYSGYVRPRSDEMYSDNPTSGIYRCADGYVQFQEARRIADFLRIIGDKDLPEAEDERAAYLASLGHEGFREKFHRLLPNHRRWDLFEKCSRERIVIAAVPDMADLLEMRPHKDREYFAQGQAGPIEALPIPGPPIRFGDGAWRNGAAPVLGSSSVEALGGLREHPAAGQPSPARVQAERPDGARPRRALEGLRVIEIAQGWAGPTIGTLMADFGADVVKVESIGRLDWWRGIVPPDDDGFTHERAALFNSINRNKSGITLDLTSKRGRELLLELVREADVFVENFTSHVIEQLRLTHDALAQVNERIISISMPAYGSTGPWRDFPALGTTVESMCGVQSLTGYEDGPPRIQGTSWDPVVGMYGCFAVMAALHRRETTGKGKHIEVSHIEAGTHYVAGPFLQYVMSGEIPRRMGNASEVFAPHGCYPTAGEDRWITIVARDDQQWESLVKVMDRDDRLRDPRFATLSERLAHRHELDGVMAERSAAWDGQELFRALQRAGVPAGPVSLPADLLADEHLAERGYFVGVDREYVGAHTYPGRFFTMSETSPAYERAAPTLGQDNEVILRDRLGIPKSELVELERTGVIGNRPVRVSHT